MQNPWKTLKSESIYKNKWIHVSEHHVIHPNGEPGIYGTVNYQHTAIGILPVDQGGFTWLVGQYRYPLGEYSWEIPEGGGPKDASPLESAKRELKEETGIEAKHWENILEMHLSNSVSDERSVSFLATDLTFGDANPEPSEVFEIKRIHFSEVFEMVNRGEIGDALAVATILKAEPILRGRGLIR